MRGRPKRPHTRTSKGGVKFKAGRAVPQLYYCPKCPLYQSRDSKCRKCPMRRRKKIEVNSLPGDDQAATMRSNLIDAMNQGNVNRGNLQEALQLGAINRDEYERISLSQCVQTCGTGEVRDDVLDRYVNDMKSTIRM